MMKSKMRGLIMKGLCSIVALLAALHGGGVVDAKLVLNFDAAESEDLVLKDNFSVDDFGKSVERSGGVYSGSIRIGPDVTTLDSLSNLEVLDGNLTIANNPFLLSLAGLENLSTVQGHKLWIFNNTNLRDLDALRRLRNVPGYLAIWNNTNLETLRLPALETVGEDLGIGDNANLLTLELPKLSNVGRKLDIQQNGKLTSLVGLEALQSVGWYFTVWDNDNLRELDLNALTSIGRFLWIWENDLLSEVVLGNLRTVGEDLWIFNNTNLRNISLETVTNLGYLEIEDNPNLTLLSLPNLLQVEGYVEIENCKSLQELNLESVTDVGGDLTIQFNPNLSSLAAGFDMLSSISGNLTIRHNPTLASIQSLKKNLTAVGGEVKIFDNGQLRTAASLQDLIA